MTANDFANAQAGTDSAVAAMLRGAWDLADYLVAGLADAFGQGDFDVAYAAVYARYLDARAAA